MDIYHIWCDLDPGVGDLEFVSSVNAYLSHLISEGKIADFRVTRRKLGLAPEALGEFHLMLEVTDLAQLDQAFNLAATRTGKVEALHSEVFSRVRNARFALYRDFPDSVRGG